MSAGGPVCQIRLLFPKESTKVKTDFKKKHDSAHFLINGSLSLWEGAAQVELHSELSG